MQLTQPNERPELKGKSSKMYALFRQYMAALAKKELTADFVSASNAELDSLNRLADSDPSLRKQIRKTQSRISNRAIKNLSYVPKHYYRTLWLAIGMSAFGIPVGVVLSTVIQNFAFVGVGLPIGLAVGIAIGTSLDQKAEKEGRQIEVEISM